MLIKNIFDVDIENSSDCIKPFISSITSGDSGLAKIYQDNPFIVSTTDGVSLTSKKSTVYKVTIDSATLNSFADALGSLPAYSTFQTCLSDNSSQSSSSTDLLAGLRKLPDNLPTFYAEVDSDHNFTRINFSKDFNGTELTFDIDFTYPESLQLTAPERATDVAQLFQSMFSGITVNPTITDYEPIDYENDDDYTCEYYDNGSSWCHSSSVTVEEDDDPDYYNYSDDCYDDTDCDYPIDNCYGDTNCTYSNDDDYYYSS